MALKVILKIGWRYLRRHPWQTILMILGITLGVAVVVAIDIANTSASQAFDLSTEAVAGKTTHVVNGGPQGLDQEIYVKIRKAGLIDFIAPIVSEFVYSPQLGNRSMQLLGIDPFTEAPFRSYLSNDDTTSNDELGIQGLVTFLTKPGAIFLSEEVARRYGIQPCQAEFTSECQITFQIAGRSQIAYVAGLLRLENNLNRIALENLILADIATAQQLTGKFGDLDRIDLILDDPVQQIPKIEAFLPPGLQVQSAQARSGTIEEMTAAFRVNLTALSLLALVVGMFLIYNTMTFSVIQRRGLFGTLRCIGVTRRELFGLVIAEALIVGSLGALLGTFLGIFLGQGAVRLVTRTINDLFFVVSVQGVQIPLESLFKGILLGILATILTSAPPAWEAASVPPRVALSRSGLETKASQAARFAGILGIALVLLGILILQVPTDSLPASFAGTFSIVVGLAMLSPMVTVISMRLVAPAFGRIWGSLGRMAPRNVVNTLSRTSIAVMALMVAVSVTIGVSLMVSSFRSTVIAWLSETLQGDIYISAPYQSATTPSIIIDPDVLNILANVPQVSRIDVLRSVSVESPDGPIQIAATNNRDIANERIFYVLDVPSDKLWQTLEDGSVIISEPFANRQNIPLSNGIVQIYTDQGIHDFPVAGIYYDYASTQGTILMSLSTYRRFWTDEAITAIALRLAPNADHNTVIQDIQKALSMEQNLLVRSNAALREEVLIVFDQTFAITSALQLLATIVAIIGILSALLSLELERQRELGILRSVGLTIRQLWRLILMETGLMGAVAGLLSIPTGYVLAVILIFIINRRSFGWTLQMDLDLSPFIQALFISIAAALLAGVYPALRIGKMLVAEAVRSE